MEINGHISVDCVVFGYDEEMLNVLLVKRSLTDNNSVDFESDWTLAGNHVYLEEKIEDAAHRILFDLTGLKDIYLEQFKAFADPQRLSKPKDQLWLERIGLDPTRKVATIGFFSLVAIQRVKLRDMGRVVRWAPINEVGELAFDHNEILNEALIALRNKMKHVPIGLELLPPKFTLSQLQNVYEQIFDAQFDKRNFRKKVNRMKYVIPLNEKQKGVPHKPAQLYKFSREVFEETKRELFDFII